MTPSLSGPASGSLPRLAISLIAAACSSTLCACRTISSPRGVTATSLALRSNSLTSSSSSSFLIATESVGCDTKHASAARPKCFSRARATMYLSSVSVMAAPSHSRPIQDGLGLEVVRAPAQPARHVAFGERGVAIQHGGRHFARPLQQGRVGLQVREAQQRRARLACPEEFAGAADLQVPPRDLEAVAGLRHRL